jgi:glycosyltransferase involved in cell wall biosynthesis
LFCDSNIRLARDAASSGYGEAVDLSGRELGDVEAREAAVYQGASAIFTLSEHTRASFVRDFGAPPAKVAAVYAGPNFDVSRVPDVSRQDSVSPPTVLFVGRQFERKGGDVLLAAFRRVRRSIPEAELVIVGPSQVAVPDAGVRCLGFLDKDRPGDWERLAAAYRSADVFCLPTRFEAFGIVFIEAMHFGLPCIGTQVWAVPEIIADGETGFVVPPDDPEALAGRLTLLLSDRALARKMGQVARARARRLFTWQAAVGRIAATLEGLCGRAARSGPAAAGQRA